MVSTRRPPTFIPASPLSQPGMTWPAPSGNENGWPWFHEASNSVPFSYRTPSYCTVTVSPGFAALPCPLARSLIFSCAGGVELIGVMTILGLAPSAPVTLTFPTGAAVAVAVGLAVLVGVAAVSSFFEEPPQAASRTAHARTGSSRRIAVGKGSRRVSDRYRR